MKILILGATGRTGKLVMQKALTKGYKVNILVRDGTKVSPTCENVAIYEGTPLDRGKLKESARDCEAILSVLHISRTSDFPWAKLRTPKTFLSEGMQNVVGISQELHINRIIVCSAWGVNETFGELPFWFQWLVKHSHIGAAYEDHGRQENILKDSNLNWTIVRPVALTDSDKSQKIQVGYPNMSKPKMTVSRKCVAAFMVEAIEDKRLIGKTPILSSK